MGWFPALGKQPVKLCTPLGGAFLGESSTGSSIQLRPSLQGCLCGSPDGLAEPVVLGATWAIATSTLKQHQTRGISGWTESMAEPMALWSPGETMIS